MQESTQKLIADPQSLHERTPDTANGLIFKDEVYAIAGAMMEVYKTLSTGYLEAVYQEALSIEFSKRGIPFEREHRLSIYYKDVKLEKYYAADFVCFGQIILEIKVVPRITSIEVAQLINYLKITKMKLGLLANFGSSPRLEWKRYIF